MKDNKEAKKELISEIKKLRKRIDKLETLEAEHKHVEEEQRERTKLYRTVLQKLPDIVYRIDPDGHFTFISNSVRILGYEPEELVGKHLSKVIHPDDVKSFSRFITLPKHKGKVTGDKNRPKLIDERRTGKRKTKDFEVRLIPKTFGRRKKDLKEKIGTVFTLGDVSATGFFEADIHEKNKKFLGTLGIIRDITERKKAEEALKQRNEFLSNIIESLSHPFYVIDVNDYMIKMANYATIGRSSEEITTCYALTHKIDKPCGCEEHRCPLEETKKTKKPVTLEHIHYDKDGNVRNVEVHAYPIFDGEGNVVQIIEYCLDITERKRIESKLKQNENMLRQIIDTTPNCIFVKDRNGMYLMVNKKMVELHSTTPEELVGKYDYEIAQKWFETVDYNEFRKAEQDVIDNKKTLFIIEEPFVYNDGTERWFQTKKIPFELEDNQNCLLVISTDITERKQAEEALRESEERFRNIYENALLGIFRTTPDGRILMANPALVKMLGFSSFEKLAQRNLEEEGYEPQYDRSVFKKRIEREGQVSGLESAWLRPDGTTLYFRENARIVRNDAGDVLYYEGTVEDITERKQAEQALKMSEEKFRTVFATSPDIIYLTDVKGSILDANLALLKLVGLPLDQIRQKNVSDFFIGDNFEELLRVADRLKAGEEIRGLEVHARISGGEVRDFEIHATPLKENGRVTKLLSVARDITERKKAEEEIKQHQRMLEASEKELKSFSRRILSIREEEKKNLSVSLHHEVGSLAVALSSNLSNIEEEIKDNNLKGALKVIEKGKTMLGQVIKRLKRMAVDLRPPDLDIIGLPDALRVYFSNVTKQAGIGINFSVGVDYKRINDKAAITLYRIVQETINNVIKHSDAKQVKIELKSLKNRIELNVCDDGKGFDTGKSVRGAKMRMGIRGMREMAESLGGTFNIKSTPGQGTEITVTLPNIEKQKS